MQSQSVFSGLKRKWQMIRRLQANIWNHLEIASRYLMLCRVIHFQNFSTTIVYSIYNEWVQLSDVHTQMSYTFNRMKIWLIMPTFINRKLECIMYQHGFFLFYHCLGLSESTTFSLLRNIRIFLYIQSTKYIAGSFRGWNINLCLASSCILFTILYSNLIDLETNKIWINVIRIATVGLHLYARNVRCCSFVFC